VFIGATIVSLGTTAPEATVSLISALQNRPSIAIGNAIGSIICNTGLVLGLYNLIKPSKINSRIFKVKGFIMLGYILFFWLLAQKRFIDPLSAASLLLLLVIYIVFNISIIQYKRHAKKKKRFTGKKYTTKKYWKHILLFLLGLILIIIGANLLVTNGIKIANNWRVPASVISLTIIALGTSLPELVTSVTALLKGHDELSVGTILGANILNICLVIGASASIRPLTIESRVVKMDIPVALGLGLLLIVPSFFSKRISRLQGLLLLCGYITYISILFCLFL